jgi:hypothetical protein
VAKIAKTTGTRTSPGAWKIRISLRRLTMRTAQKCEQEAAREAAEFLVGLHGADDLLLGRARQPAQLGQARDDARRLLNRAEGRRIRRRHHHRRHDRRACEPRLKQLGEARALQRAGQLLLAPRR